MGEYETKKRISISKIIAFAILLFYSKFFYNFATAETRIKGYCKEIKIGSSIQEVSNFAKTHDLSPLPKDKNGISFIVEAKTFGRWGCELEFSDGILIKVEYNFMD